MYKNGGATEKRIKIRIKLMTKIQEAKRQLYFLLLKKQEDELTDTEVDIQFYLFKDEQIQEIYRK